MANHPNLTAVYPRDFDTKSEYTSISVVFYQMFK